MGLAEEIQAAQYVRRCKIAEIMDDLTPDDAAALERMSADSAVTFRAIIKALRGRGYVVSDKTLARHRRGECEC